MKWMLTRQLEIIILAVGLNQRSYQALDKNIV